MNSSLVYIGDVKVTVSRKSYKYKNSGTIKLFEYFSRWLAGESINRDVLPSYLTITYLTNSSGTPINESLTASNIEISSQYKTNDQLGPCTIITGIILKTGLNDIPKLQPSDYDLNLCNQDDDVLATIKLSSDIIEQVNTGRQALVEWTLRLSNKET